MNERDKLIQKLIEEKGGSYDDYLNLLNAIGYHESAHTMDPTIKQIGGGPGRGKYQFEEGKNAGGITAAKRTAQYYKENNIPVPQWLKEATTSDSLDATKLSSEQQDILFLGNMRKHPKANFKNIWDGKETVSDFWANYHWAGDPKDRNKRLESFNRSLESLKKNPYTEITPKENKENKEYNLTFNDSTPIRKRVKESTLIAQKEYKSPELNPIVNNVNKIGNLDNIMSYMNQKAMGGYVNDSIDKTLNSFNTGGLHEQNPLGGIPQGIGSNGKINTVEENETSFQLTKLGKYIFSNRLSLDGNIGNYNKTNNSFPDGGKIDPPIKKMNINNIKNPTLPTDEELQKVNDYINREKYEKPLKYREDFDGNILSPFLSKLGRHGNLKKYYYGQPLSKEDQDLRYSKYRPEDETDSTSEYISINDQKFKDAILHYTNNYYPENDNGKAVRPSYAHTPEGHLDKKLIPFIDLGNFKLKLNKDSEGEYIQYYDIWNRKRLDSPDLDETDTGGATKPFEIYDRIYVEKDSTGKYVFKKKNKK